MDRPFLIRLKDNFQNRILLNTQKVAYIKNFTVPMGGGLIEVHFLQGEPLTLVYYDESIGVTRAQSIKNYNAAREAIDKFIY